MENDSFEKPTHNETPKTPEKRKVLVVESDLSDLKLSPGAMALLLEKLNQLHAEDKVATVEEAREIAPTIDLSELKKGEPANARIKPPRHTTKKSEKY
ncbi:MAG: hypothetical protein A3D57_04455 [Candidatus Sungbacteria bacterium RIFCSPHIGHO2_02_FULL_46_12]|nr:MAG: hypothetical protein A3D57_04455 [Candidatus Sungbacteria bacterium RIFCSPHIGHO2_02_FULL_46_12]